MHMFFMPAAMTIVMTVHAAKITGQVIDLWSGGYLFRGYLSALKSTNVQD